VVGQFAYIHVFDRYRMHRALLHEFEWIFKKALAP
jgi:hypothetical protein